MGFRFIHTADWQLGLPVAFIHGDPGTEARLARYQTVHRIAELAREREVDAVIVAGDVLDSNAAGHEIVSRSRDALASFAPVPVYLIAGNHDHGGAHCVLPRVVKDLPGVHALLERAPVPLPRATLYPCSLQQRHERVDPARWLPRRAEGEGIRVAIAHGGVIDFGALEGSGDFECPNLLSVSEIVGKGFDYVALGDWHGLRKVEPRAWYSGTHEATRFKEKEPGHVLVVDIDGPGELPRVEAVRVASTRWLTLDEHVAGDADVEGLIARLLALPEPRRSCVALTVEGTLSLAGRNLFDARIEQLRGALMHLELDDRRVVAEPSPADLEALSSSGFVRAAVERLLASSDPAARDALHLLHRLVVTGEG